MDVSLGPLTFVFLALACALAVGCFLLAGRRARRIDKMSVPSLRDLVRELRKLPVEDRPGELLRIAAAGTWEHRLASEILDAPPFYYAETYHQQYLGKDPGGYCGLGGTGVTCPLPSAKPNA